MRKAWLMIIIVLAMMLLLGCNTQEKNKLRVLIEYDVGAEELYTPESYKEYEAAKISASNCLDKIFVGNSQLDGAKQQLQEKIRNLCIKADKFALLDVIKTGQSKEEKRYTTKSYERLKSALLNGKKINDDENVPQQMVDEAVEHIEESIKELELAQKGIYEINTTFSLHFNHSVGNEWIKEIIYNRCRLESKDEIIANLGEKIIISGKIIEQDSYPDMGCGSLELDLKEETVENTQIIVQENKGQYSGNIAVWKMECRAVLKEQI